MTDEQRPDEAPQAPPPPAEQYVAAYSAAEPPAAGPVVTPPPVSTWGQDAAPTAPIPAHPAEQPGYGPPVGGYAPPPAYGHTPEPPHRPGIGTAITAAFLTALIVGAVAGLAGGFLGWQLADRWQGGNASGSSGTVTVVPAKTDEPVAAAAAAAVPAVVNIDDVFGQRLAAELATNSDVRLVTTGREPKADYRVVSSVGLTAGGRLLASIVRL